MNVENIATDIKERFPEIDFSDRSDKDHVILEFKTPTQEEYTFLVQIGIRDIHASIFAKLIEARKKEYFWYYPFEPNLTDKEDKKLFDSLDFIYDQLEIITNHETRIIQQKGWISQTFSCEYLKQDKWIRLYRHSGLRVSLNFPEIEGRQRKYK